MQQALHVLNNFSPLPTFGRLNLFFFIVLGTKMNQFFRYKYTKFPHYGIKEIPVAE